MLSHYWSAVKEWRSTGDDSLLKPFEGKTVMVKGQKIALVTDPNDLVILERSGELDIVDMYERSIM